MSANGDRTRTFTWQDPMASAVLARERSGMEVLQAVIDGTLPPPPIAELLAMELVEVHEGHAVFAVEPAEWMYNPIGSVHGGIAATLLDSCMGCAIHTTLPAGVGYTTLEIKVNFVRPILGNTGMLRAEGKIISGGKRIGTAEGRVVDSEGRLYAHGTTTCLIFPL